MNMHNPAQPGQSVTLIRCRRPEVQLPLPPASLRGRIKWYGRNETQNEALERARSEGITGPVLLVPSVMTYEEWAAMMEKEANCDRPDE